MDNLVLPAPRKTGGKPLLDTLAQRKTIREIEPEPLSDRVLSDLMWAACGINRTADGRRTAPSAKNSQEIDVYVATEKGVYLYRAQEHILEAVLEEDLRAASGRQDWVAGTPVNLIYVADESRMGDLVRSDWVHLSAADAAFMAQNVYLFCTSEGLASVVRNDVDKTTLAARMRLRPDQRVVLAQSVGRPSV